MSPLVIVAADPAAPDVQAIIDRHLSLMRAVSPPESVFAQTAEGLVRDGAHLFAAHRPGAAPVGNAEERPLAAPVGIGAVKIIAPGEAELKSMHVVDEARGSGAGRMLLERLLRAARDLGARSVSLETGRAPAFAPAIALYESAGFVECGPFGAYRANPFSRFFRRDL